MLREKLGYWMFFRIDHQFTDSILPGFNWKVIIMSMPPRLFLVITRRRVLEMARVGQIPAHAIGESKRKMWRFRLSEFAEAIVAKKPAASARKSGIIETGSPRQPNRRN